MIKLFEDKYFDKLFYEAIKDFFSILLNLPFDLFQVISGGYLLVAEGTITTFRCGLGDT